MLQPNRLKTCQTSYTNHDSHRFKTERGIIDKPDKMVNKPVNKPVKPVCELKIEHVTILL